MDLAQVLADGTDGLGNATLARYYRDIFASFPEVYPGAFRVRACLHVGIQQLATRSRVAPDRERFLQVGCFDPRDLEAASIEAMEHTVMLQAASPSGLADASFGLVVVFSEGAEADLSSFVGLLNPAGRILSVYRQTALIPPTISLHAKPDA